MLAIFYIAGVVLLAASALAPLVFYPRFAGPGLQKVRFVFALTRVASLSLLCVASLKTGFNSIASGSNASIVLFPAFYAAGILLGIMALVVACTAVADLAKILVPSAN